ncbi:helix-turn-helix domain-containing protein [Treponema primitia]|uniref:hypothetical protein n=1 Tax=Treponema primitia TaxID=88058 RepID=UPI00397F7DB7
MELETRSDVMSRILERLDRLSEIGVIAPDGDILIDVKEAAAIACVDKDTILTWGQNGKIPRYKISGCVRFGLREFCNWVSSCRQPSLAERKAEKMKANWVLSK